MATTDQLSIVPQSAQPSHKFTLNRFVRVEASVLAPVVWTNLSYILNINIGAPSFQSEAQLFHQGGGDRSRRYKRGPLWTGSFTCYQGKSLDVLAQLFGISTSTTYGLNLLVDNELPQIHLECIVRDFDNLTHLYTVVFEDLVIQSPAVDHPLDTADFVIPFYTESKPWILKTGYEMVYDKYTGSGSTTTFTLSSTPVACVSAALYNTQFDYTKLASLKKKLSTEDTGTFIKSGASVTGTTLTITTAPEAASEVQVFYPKLHT
jgi:hypothetical protein